MQLNTYHRTKANQLVDVLHNCIPDKSENVIGIIGKFYTGRKATRNIKC